jgi:hypothetical protein
VSGVLYDLGHMVGYRLLDPMSCLWCLLVVLHLVVASGVFLWGLLVHLHLHMVVWLETYVSTMHCRRSRCIVPDAIIVRSV